MTFCPPLQERGELLELQEVRGEVRGERGSILPLSEFKSYPKMEKNATTCEQIVLFLKILLCATGHLDCPSLSILIKTVKLVI